MGIPCKYPQQKRISLLSGPLPALIEAVPPWTEGRIFAGKKMRMKEAFVLLCKKEPPGRGV
jgi:hypothetical protein